MRSHLEGGVDEEVADVQEDEVNVDTPQRGVYRPCTEQPQHNHTQAGAMGAGTDAHRLTSWVHDGTGLRHGPMCNRRLTAAQQQESRVHRSGMQPHTVPAAATVVAPLSGLCHAAAGSMVNGKRERTSQITSGIEQSDGAAL